VCAAVLIGALAACSSSDDTAAAPTTTKPTDSSDRAAVTQLTDLSWLRVSQDGGRPHIVDSEGREVLLRGANFNQIGDYYQANADLTPTKAPTAADWDGMAANGFSVVRLLVHWSALEPTKGAFDKEYVAKIHKAVADAGARGIYTVIDFHQDAWGKYIASPKGAVCKDGTEPAIGWDGAPKWATITGGANTCRPKGSREGAPAVQAAFTNFYRNTDGIRDHFTATVAKVAKEFATDPRVAGYDLLNEPNLVLSAAESEQRYTELVADAVAKVRAAEKTVPRSLPHLIFIEPIVLFPLPGSMPTKTVSDDPNLVFAPHNYAESIGPKILTVEQTMSISADAAKERGWPLWIGEYGVFSRDAEQLAVLRRFAAAEDTTLASGSTEWQWRQRCGDPHTVSTPDGKPTGEVVQLNFENCPEETDGGPNKALLKIVGRAYPRAAPGHLTKLTSDPTTGKLVIEGTRGSQQNELVVWVPGTVKPSPTVTGLAQVTTARAEGGFYVTAVATARSYTLRLPAR